MDDVERADRVERGGDLPLRRDVSHDHQLGRVGGLVGLLLGMKVRSPSPRMRGGARVGARRAPETEVVSYFGRSVRGSFVMLSMTAA